MTAELLETPVRLTWELPEADSTHGSDLAAIAERIADGGVFYVTLLGRPLCHPRLGDVLSRLANCQQLISCGGDPEELSALAALPPGQRRVLLDLSGFISAEGRIAAPQITKAITRLRELGSEPLPSLVPVRQNLRLLPDLLRLCSEQGVTGFKLPNAHIGDSFHRCSAEDLPRWQDLDDFRALWAGSTPPGLPLPALEIHDLFLWEIMTPDQQQNRSEYGGCQAADSLGHVDRQGRVHPCAAWPQPLGRLPGQSLEAIWAGPERMAVRQHVASPPAGCTGCRDLALCFGGCRGLAYHFNRAAGERDLMCPGPR